MRILSTSFLRHDSSITIIDNGNIDEYVLAERKTRRKHDPHVLQILENDFINDLENKNIDAISNSFFIKETEKHYEEFFSEVEKNKVVVSESHTEDHHLCHAYSGFYSSKFDHSLVIVVDGNGSFINLDAHLEKNDTEKYLESLSVYEFKNGKLEKTLFKEYFPLELFHRFVLEIDKTLGSEIYGKLLDDAYDKKSSQCILGIDTKYPIGIGNLYFIVSESLGFFGIDGCGKVMGLAQYKFHKKKLPEGYSDDEWKTKVDISYRLQKITEKKILNIIKKYVNETGIKNVVLSGGVFLNCVSNYNLVKKISDVSFHVDPICSDNGISIGRGLSSYIERSGKLPDRIENCYLGHQESNHFLKEKIKKTNFSYIENIQYSDIVDIILKGEVVSLFQGKSESGQRSLGNRSLLFDPRISDGRSVVNRIKKRENYRPFAASILLEYVNDWFDLKSLVESPTMSFAVDAFERAVKEVPAVVHADNTCRIQTITKKQNIHFYNLIKEFYGKTNVPMLLNTSFNLAGEPLVETFDDALSVLKNSELKYIYFPEIDVLLSK